MIIGAKPLDLWHGRQRRPGVLNNYSGPNTFGGSITLDSDSQITATAGFLLLTGISSSNGSSLTLSGAGNLQIAGSIDASVVNLNKYGAGFDILSGASAFSGQTSIYSGMLRLQNSSGVLGQLQPGGLRRRFLGTRRRRPQRGAFGQ